MTLIDNIEVEKNANKKKNFIAEMVILIDENDFALKIFHEKDVFQGSGLKGLIFKWYDGSNKVNI